MTKVKICGITNVKDALLAEKSGAHIIGMIFAESPRKITISKAKKIVNALKFSTQKSGVFVNEKINVLNNIIKKLGLNFVQLSGEEKPSYIKKIKGAKIIKVIRIKDKKSLIKDINKYKKIVHLFLFDTYDKNKFGGTGKTFNWNIIKGVSVPYFVAGGIGPSNVKNVITKLNPYGVDVNSGVELYPGKKSFQKIKKLFKEIKKIKR